MNFPTHYIFLVWFAVFVIAMFGYKFGKISIKTVVLSCVVPALMIFALGILKNA